MTFSLVTGLFQFISLLVTLLLIIVLIHVLHYVNWKKRHDVEIAIKLDQIIEQLKDGNKPL